MSALTPDRPRVTVEAEVTPAMVARIDALRSLRKSKRGAALTRSQWIREALTEKAERDEGGSLEGWESLERLARAQVERLRQAEAGVL